MEIEPEYLVGLLPLGKHDKVLGRAPPSNIQKPASFLRKDANFPEKTQSKLSTTMNALSKKMIELDSKPEDDYVEPHMIPETSIIRSLTDVKND